MLASTKRIVHLTMETAGVASSGVGEDPVPSESDVGERRHGCSSPVDSLAIRSGVRHAAKEFQAFREKAATPFAGRTAAPEQVRSRNRTLNRSAPDADPQAWLRELPPMDLFGALLFQVVGQQLSVAATRRTIARIEADVRWAPSLA